MAEEVYELVARLTPEGAQETEAALEGAREEFESTTETVEQSSGDLEDFSARFEGALGVTATALAVAAGGLLSTVPIIGEVFSALGALIDSIALKIDGVLRPALGPVTEDIYRWADSINQLEGPAADLVGWAGAIAAAVLGAAGAIIATGSALGTFTSLSITGAGALGTVASAIGSVAGAIISLPAALVIAAAAFNAFVIAYVTNFAGVRDTTNRVVGQVIDEIGKFVGYLKTVLVIGAETAFDLVVNAAKQFANGFVAAFEGAVNSAREGVVNGINNIVRTIIRGVNQAISALNKLKGVNIGRVNFQPISGGGDVSFGRPFETTTQRAIAARGGRRTSQAFRQLLGESDVAADLVSVLRDLRDGQRQEQPVEIDGRRVGRHVGGFGAVQTSNRGR